MIRVPSRADVYWRAYSEYGRRFDCRRAQVLTMYQLCIMHTIMFMSRHVCSLFGSFSGTSMTDGGTRGVMEAQIESLVRASGALTSAEVRDVCRACEIGKAVLSTSLRGLASMDGGGPFLSVKMADGTPINVSKKVVTTLPGGNRKISRTGRETHEYLVKCQFGRRMHPNGSHITRCAIQDAVPLSEGKSVAAQFQVCTRDWVTARDLGFRGVCTDVYVFDRFALVTWEKLWKRWHKLKQSEYDSMAGEIPLSQFQDMTFLFFLGCAAHDAHNSLKWALWFRFDTKEVLTDAWVAVASLRNSMDLLSSHIGEWVSSRLSYAPTRSLEEMRAHSEVFAALGVEPDVLELITERYQLCFENGQLLVNAAQMSNPALVSEICAVYHALWHFVPFTESRWMTVGVSSRTIVTCEILGMKNLVTFIKGRPNVSKFYINGYARAVGDTLSLMVEASIVSRVSDAVLHVLCEDSRVLRQLDELWETASEELVWITQLSDGVWKALAAVSNVDWEFLRSECTHAATVSYHFFWRRVLLPASQRPFSLATGDIRENLRDLASEDESPPEGVTAQLWRLLRGGFPESQLVQAVEQWKDIPWTTTIVEQMHGSLAVLRRAHPEYGGATLASRAFVMQLRKFLPKPSGNEKKLALLLRDINKISRRAPERGRGRQQFLADLIELAKGRDWSGREAPPTTKEIFSRHAGLWAKRSLAERMAYEDRACLRAREKHDLFVQDLEALRARVAVVREDIEVEAALVPQVSMASAALSPASMELYEELLEGNDFKPEIVAVKRAASLSAPPMPSYALQKALYTQVIHMDPKLPEPWWTSLVTARRNSFRTCGLEFRWEEEVVYYKICYAVKSPQSVCLMQMVPRDEFEETPVPAASSYDEILSRHNELYFNVLFGDLVLSSDLADRPRCDMYVIEHLVHGPGAKVSSAFPPMLFSEFLDDHPPDVVAKTKSGSEGSSSASKKKGVDGLGELLPWVLQSKVFADSVFVPREAKAKRVPGSGDSSDSDAEPFAELSDKVIEAGMVDLEKTKNDLLSHEGAMHDHFGTRTIGTLGWTLQYKGTACDAIGAWARTNAAISFCARHGVPKSIRFERTAYSDADAGICSRAWAHRMQWFFTCEFQDPSLGSGPMPAALVEEYMEPTEFTKLGERSTGVLTGRVRSIRKLFA